MIATVRGLAALAAIAVVFAILVVAGVGRAPAAVDRALVPHFDPRAVTALVWKRRGGADVELRAGEHGWTMVAPPGAVDSGAVEAVLAALRGARWHRRGRHGAAGAISTTLTFGSHAIGFGGDVYGADQAWLEVDDTPLLVDGWVARALDPEPLALRDRTPLATVPRGADVTLRGPVTVDLALAKQGTAAGRIAPALIARLHRALDGLVYVRLPDAPVAAGPFALRAGTIELAIGAPCPGAPRLIAIHAPTGDGCADPAAWRELLEAAAAIAGPPAEILDPRPAGDEPARITMRGGVLELAKRPRLVRGTDTRDLDPDRVAELIAALAEPAALVAVPTSGTRASLTVESKAGTSIVLDVYDGNVIARRGEALALRMTPAAWAIVMRPVMSLVDPTRWGEDPSTVSVVSLDDVTYHRGAVLGEWMRDPAGTVDAALIEAVASAAARVRAPSLELPPAFAPLHRLTIVLAPPVGGPTRHAIVLGPPGPDGCPARIDGVGALAPLALCTAVDAAAKH